MFRTKYYYNPETLNIEKIKCSRKRLFLNIVKYLAGGTILFTIFLYVSSTFVYDDGKELKRENLQLKLQYQVLSQDITRVKQALSSIQNKDDNIYRAIFGMDPVPKTIRKAGSGGIDIYKNLEGFENSEMIINTKKKLEAASKELYIQSKSLDEIIKNADDLKEKLTHIPSSLPIPRNKLKKNISGWGYRTHPIYRKYMFHYGLDFAAPKGTKIYATGDGVVEETTRSSTGFGNKVVINHGYKYKTLYAHMTRFIVRKGQKIKRGDVIGYVGSTGRSTGYHCHYEVHKNGKKMNPESYLFMGVSPHEFKKLIQITYNIEKAFKK